MVESAQISDSLVQSTVSISPNEQLQIVQQRLLTRANLLGIARKFEVFEDMAEMTADSIVREMRDATKINVQSGRSQATRMGLTFSATTPRTAALVLNEYITIVLNENSEFRSKRATGTLEFFEQEVARLSTNLDQQSDKIMTFQAENQDSLPSTLSYRLDRQGQLQETMGVNQRERLTLTDQKRRIVQLFEMTGGRQQFQSSASPLEAQLASLEADMRQALLVYSKENPRVKILQARIDGLRTEVEAENESAGRPEDPGAAMMELQLQEIDKRIEVLDAENAEAKAEIDLLQITIEKTGGNEIALEALEREYSILENQYNAAVARLSTAATGERIEVLSKGERITVVEQPTIPDEPTSPNRPLIAGAGSLAGMTLAAGLIVLLELMNSAIRRPIDLTNRFGITPLGVLPVIRTPGDRFIKGGAMLAVVTLVVVGVPAALFAVHTYYLPLDLLAIRAMARLGI